MSKVTKKKLQADHNKLLNQFAELVRSLKSSKVISEETCPTFYRRTTEIVDDICEQAEPKPKQLTQSVFNGLDEKWRFAAVDGNKGFPIVYEFEPYAFDSEKYYSNHHGLYKDLTHLTGYDASNWQNSLIERDTAKELLEVDLSSELTGSDLCRKMLERGDKYVMCMVDDGTDVICDLACFVSSTHPFIGRLDNYKKVTPINNQGEPLTQAEAGL